MVAFCALGRMCRYDACTKRGQVSGMIQRPSGKPVFCLFFSPLRSYPHSLYNQIPKGSVAQLLFWFLIVASADVRETIFAGSISRDPRRVIFTRLVDLFGTFSSFGFTDGDSNRLGQCSIALRSRLWMVAARESRESIFRFACMFDIHIVDGRKRTRSRRRVCEIDLRFTRDKIREK